MESPNPTMTPQKAFAIERLMRDYREIEENPLPTIIAQPKEDNIFNWHANLIGVKGSDYDGSIIHMEIIYPEDYPMSPPKVRLLTTVKRDHVFGEWICLDMLQSWSGFSNEKYTGWTTAYTTLSILLQLQAFIFESEKVASSGGIKIACINASTYCCGGCPHNMVKYAPWPWRPYMQKPLTKEETIARFESPQFKRAYEEEQKIEQMVQERIKQDKGKPVSEAVLKLYRDEAIRRLEEMRKFVEDNRRKMEKRMNNEKKKVEQDQKAAEEKKLSEAAANSSKKKNDVPKIVAKNDKKLEVLWHTKLNVLAPTFVPKSQRQNSAPETTVVSPQISEVISEDLKTENIFDVLPFDMIYEIFSYIRDNRDFSRIAKVCKLFKNYVENSFILERRECVCFHSKRSFQDDVLGVGITIDKHPKSGDIQYVTTRLDLLSHTAFYQEEVRKSVWQEPFTHWVPLYLNGGHGDRAYPLLVQEIEGLYSKPFEPMLVMDLFAKLMNTMVVSVMNGSTHASIVALQGYCYFHRMLISMVEKFPHLKAVVDQRVKDFVSDEYYRHKRQCPSIGDFLPLLTISSYTWGDVAVPVVKETLIRNVLWITKQYPALSKVSKEFHANEEEKRSKFSFTASRTSLRLIMFHVYFLLRVAKVGKVSVEEVAKGYDMRYGRPERDMEAKLQKAIFQIMDVSDYKGYFTRVKLPVPSDNMLYILLRESVENSLKKRYHKLDFGKKKEVKKPAAKPKRKDVVDDFNSHEFY